MSNSIFVIYHKILMIKNLKKKGPDAFKFIFNKKGRLSIINNKLLNENI